MTPKTFPVPDDRRPVLASIRQLGGEKTRHVQRARAPRFDVATPIHPARDCGAQTTPTRRIAAGFGAGPVTRVARMRPHRMQGDNAVVIPDASGPLHPIRVNEPGAPMTGTDWAPHETCPRTWTHGAR